MCTQQGVGLYGNCSRPISLGQTLELAEMSATEQQAKKARSALELTAYCDPFCEELLCDCVRRPNYFIQERHRNFQQFDEMLLTRGSSINAAHLTDQP